MPHKLKSAPKIKTEWNLKQLYTSPSDPRLERDMKIIARKHEAFAKKYQNKTGWLKNERQLVQALKDYEKTVLDAKPIIFLKLWLDIKSNDSVAEGKLNKMMDLLVKAGNRVMFFELALSKIPAKQQKRYLENRLLAPFHYFLSQVFKLAKHNLSEAEEKILNLKNQPAHRFWVNGVSKQLSKLTVKYRGKDIPISEASFLIPSLPTGKRRELHRLVTDQYKTVGDFSESEINAIVNNKKINDELRSFETPYESTVLHYQNKPKTVATLVKTVSKNNKLGHRFYKIKAKILGLKRLTYADRAAQIGKNNKKISFNQSLGTLRKIFGATGKQFLDILDLMIANGQIDVFPRQHKRGGAYCLSTHTTPTFVMLNHLPDFNSTMTFAHEMGHAIHSELTKSKQRPIYQGYSIAVAEVASTLFESFVFEEVFKTLSAKERVIALHDKIQSDVATIFRQIACFNFEVALHEQIRQKGALPKEEIAKLLNKHMSSYLGPVVKLSPDDGYFFVSWSHIRNFFYVYSYAHGQLISKALFAKYQADPEYLKTIISFLEAGGSGSPEDIFKDAGIDITKPEFFQTGLKEIERDIKRLEKLIS